MAWLTIGANTFNITYRDIKFTRRLRIILVKLLRLHLISLGVEITNSTRRMNLEIEYA